MNKIDCNCFTGSWPFRKLREYGMDAILKKHRENEIDCGCVASLNSVFYNDPLEGESELAQELRGTGYRHVMSVNPMLPGFEEDILKKSGALNACAVRIYPGCHGYSLNENPRVERLCELLGELKLPLFISLRLEDERLCYLLKQQTPEEFGLPRFLEKERDLRVLLLTIRKGELDYIKFPRNIWFDTSGLKDRLFTIESLSRGIGRDRMVYGSQYPLFSLRASLYLVERDGLDETEKLNILQNNAMELLCGRRV